MDGPIDEPVDGPCVTLYTDPNSFSFRSEDGKTSGAIEVSDMDMWETTDSQGQSLESFNDLVSFITIHPKCRLEAFRGKKFKRPFGIYRGKC